MQQGFLYLVAIIDWATRRVLSWRLSNTLTARFCVEALSEALARFGKPGIFNTDQSLPSRKRGARNSPATNSPRCCGITGSRSAWMDAGAATARSVQHAFLLSSTGVLTAIAEPGSDYTEVNGLNDLGQIVGNTNLSGFLCRFRLFGQLPGRNKLRPAAG